MSNIDYSIIIPAFNEAELLPATLVSVRSAMAGVPGKGELIVVDNNSTDDTALIAAESGARVVIETVNQIARARNRGSEAALGRCLVFLDADTLVTRELLGTAMAMLESGKFCGGGVSVQGDVELSLSARFCLWTWNSISYRFNLAAGCFLFCLQDAFKAVGGFDERFYAAEEIRISRLIRKWGKHHGMKFEIITDPVITTSMRKLEWYPFHYLFWHALVILLLPTAVRCKRMCRPWYVRPEGVKSKK